MSSNPSVGTPNIIQRFLSLIKFSHTIFAMPFALIGMVLGFVIEPSISFSWKIFIAIILCMVFARNAAMAFNRFLDRDIDAKNPRTVIREIPAGLISSSSALRFVIINSILFIATTYFINEICFYLSPVALFVILFYSFTKRFTPLCHLVLGVGLGLAPIGAFLSVTGYFHLVPVLLSLAVFTWVAGFDIIYALQDEEFDKNEGLHSIPGYFGKSKALRISELLHLVTAVLLFVPTFIMNFGFLYYIGYAFFISLLIYQHKIVSPHDLSKVNLSFGVTNGVASVLFAVFTISSLLMVKYL